MRDRLGAIGGTLEVDSAPGEGARVRGRVPVDDAMPDEVEQQDPAGLTAS
jgi:signal transduction histidine kinase